MVYCTFCWLISPTWIGKCILDACNGECTMIQPPMSRKIKNTVDPSIIAGVEEGSPKIEVKALVYSIIAFFASLFLGVMFIDSDLLSAIFSLVRFVSFVIFVFSLISMLFSSFKNAADAVKYFDNDKKRSSSLYNFCMVAVPIFLIVFPIIYHNVGPRGAVNNCFSNELPTFVSCRKSTELGGTTVYSCFRRGAKAVVSCDGDTCNAICEV